MKKQYIVQKYVMADNVDEAIKKSRTLPIHEVFVHNNHFEKELNYNFFLSASAKKQGFQVK